MSESSLTWAISTRALVRVQRGSAATGFALALLTVVFLMVGAQRPATWVPQVLILGTGWLTANTVAMRATALLARLRRCPGQEAEILALVSPLLRRATRISLALGILAGSGCLIWLRPTSTTLLSVAVSMAILVQLAVVFTALRSAVSRVRARLAVK
ncbi:MAG: hypothetical protein ACK5MT_13025 [Actinomycetales bacterium]